MRFTCCRQEGWGGLCPGKHGPHWQGEDGLLLIQALQYCCLCRCCPWAAQQVAAILWAARPCPGEGRSMPCTSKPFCLLLPCTGSCALHVCKPASFECLPNAECGDHGHRVLCAGGHGGRGPQQRQAHHAGVPPSQAVSAAAVMAALLHCSVDRAAGAAKAGAVAV